jgi:hypothetical protein
MEVMKLKDFKPKLPKSNLIAKTSDQESTTSLLIDSPSNIVINTKTSIQIPNNQLPTIFTPTTSNFVEDLLELKESNTTSISRSSTQELHENTNKIDDTNLFDPSTSISLEKEDTVQNDLNVIQETPKSKLLVSLQLADAIFQNYQTPPKKKPKNIANFAKPLKEKKEK